METGIDSLAGTEPRFSRDGVLSLAPRQERCYAGPKRAIEEQIGCRMGSMRATWAVPAQHYKTPVTCGFVGGATSALPASLRKLGD